MYLKELNNAVPFFIPPSCLKEVTLGLTALYYYVNLQEEKNDMTYVEGFAHQLEVNSLPRSQHLSKARLDSIPTKWHSRYAGKDC